MAIQFFDEVDSSAPDSVDWIKAVIKSGGDYETPRMVYQCTFGLKGILVITSHWKSFLFRGSVMHNHLAEALPQYTRITTGLPQLIACGTRDGKCRLGLNSEVDIMYWIQEQDTYYQKYNGGDGDTESPVRGNPLLPSPIPPSQTTARTTASQRGKAPKLS